MATPSNQNQATPRTKYELKLPRFIKTKPQTGDATTNLATPHKLLLKSLSEEEARNAGDVSSDHFANQETRSRSSAPVLLTPEITATDGIQTSTWSKEDQEKLCILREILLSEKKYLNDIKEIVEGYHEEIFVSCNANEAFVYQIFSNIKDILAFTKTFYNLLLEQSDSDVSIAKCFIDKHGAFMDLYSIYCQNLRRAHSYIEAIESDIIIGKIIEKVKAKYGHPLKMATYLQLPVLRLTKYHLLLQRYLGLLDKDTDAVAYAHVHEALECMKKVNTKINSYMGELIPKDTALARVQLHTHMQPLINIFGRIVKQGELILCETKKVHTIILFETMLIIRKCDNSTKIMHSIACENLSILPTSNGHKSSQLSFTIIDYNNRYKVKTTSMWQFTFKAKSIEEKQEWQKAIMSCMLKGYGEKVCDQVKTSVMKINIEKTSQAEQIGAEKRKFYVFKHLTDFRSSLKNKVMSKPEPVTMFAEEHFETKDASSFLPLEEAIDANDRRMSAPVQSLRFMKIINKRYHPRADKIFEENEDTATLGTSHLNHSEFKPPPKKLFHKPMSTIVPLCEKLTAAEYHFGDADSSEIEVQRGGCEQLGEYNFCQTIDYEQPSAVELYDEIPWLHNKPYDEPVNDPSHSQLHSQSSLNSEEGYYSNHDSSTTTNAVSHNTEFDNGGTPAKTTHIASPIYYSLQRTFSSPEFKKPTPFIDEVDGEFNGQRKMLLTNRSQRQKILRINNCKRVQKNFVNSMNQLSLQNKNNELMCISLPDIETAARDSAPDDDEDTYMVQAERRPSSLLELFARKMARPTKGDTLSGNWYVNNEQASTHAYRSSPQIRANVRQLIMRFENQNSSS